MQEAERRAAYAADVTYVTNSELGFDYLRDNLAQASTAGSDSCAGPAPWPVLHAHSPYQWLPEQMQSASMNAESGWFNARHLTRSHLPSILLQQDIHFLVSCLFRMLSSSPAARGGPGAPRLQLLCDR